MLRAGWLSLQFLGVFGFSIIPPLGTCQRQCLYLLSVCVDFLVLLTVVTHRCAAKPTRWSVHAPAQVSLGGLTRA